MPPPTDRGPRVEITILVVRKHARGRKCNKMVVHAFLPFLPFLAKQQRGELELQSLGTDYGGWTKYRGAGHHNWYIIWGAG